MSNFKCQIPKAEIEVDPDNYREKLKIQKNKIQIPNSLKSESTNEPRI